MKLLDWLIRQEYVETQLAIARQRDADRGSLVIGPDSPPVLVSQLEARCICGDPDDELPWFCSMCGGRAVASLESQA